MKGEDKDEKENSDRNGSGREYRREVERKERTVENVKC